MIYKWGNGNANKGNNATITTVDAERKWRSKKLTWGGLQCRLSDNPFCQTRDDVGATCRKTHEHSTTANAECDGEMCRLRGVMFLTQCFFLNISKNWICTCTFLEAGAYTILKTHEFLRNNLSPAHKNVENLWPFFFSWRFHCCSEHRKALPW